MDHSSGLVFRRPQAASHRRAVVYFCSAVLRRSKVYEMLAQGDLPSVRIGGSVRVPVAALDDWIARKIDEVE